MRAPKHDLTGKTFGHLRVLRMKQDHDKCPQGSFFAICKCLLCGNTVSIMEYSLRKRKTASCGCVKDYRNRTGENHCKFTGHKEIRGKKWYNLQRSAKRRGISFDVNIEEAWNVYEEQDRRCALTGLPIAFGKSEETSTASLDRIDSSIGYSKKNIQWTHRDINRIKSDLPQNYFIELCRLVAKND